IAREILFPFQGGRPEARLAPMVRGKAAVLLVLLFIPFTASAQQKNQNHDESKQLQRYLKIAAQNNPVLRAKYYEYRAVLEQAPHVSTLPDPSVIFMYFVNPDQYSNPFIHSAISVMQKFPWFDTLKAAENRVKQSAKAKRAAVINARNELFRNIKKVWFQMYKMHHHIKIMNENLELLQSLKSQALSLYETGENSQVDILRLQMETDKMKTRLRQTKEKLKPLRSQFNNLLN